MSDRNWPGWRQWMLLLLRWSRPILLLPKLKRVSMHSVLELISWLLLLLLLLPQILRGPGWVGILVDPFVNRVPTLVRGRVRDRRFLFVVDRAGDGSAICLQEYAFDGERVAGLRS